MKCKIPAGGFWEAEWEMSGGAVGGREVGGQGVVDGEKA